MTPKRIDEFGKQAFNLYIDVREDCHFEDAVKVVLRAALEEQRQATITALMALTARSAQGVVYVQRDEAIKAVE